MRKEKRAKITENYIAENQEMINARDVDHLADIEMKEQVFTINMNNLPKVADVYAESLQYQEERINSMLKTEDN